MIIIITPGGVFNLKLVPIFAINVIVYTWSHVRSNELHNEWINDNYMNVNDIVQKLNLCNMLELKPEAVVQNLILPYFF